MSVEFFYLLLLIVVSNGAPVVLRNVLGRLGDVPIDMGRDFIDGNRLFGATKTWRGLLFSMVATACIAFVLGYGVLTGVLIALGAMTGDLMSSFFKRRMGLRSSAMAPMLDQIPESLLPALLVMQHFSLQMKDVVILVLAFIIVELLLSRILYKLGLRRTPY